MQINFLSQMHLTLSLLPILKNTTGSRIVYQSSELHRMAPSSLSFSDSSDLIDDIGPAHLYNRTKLAQLCFARALDRRLQPGGRLAKTSDSFQGPWVNATHPGAVHTDQQKQAQEAYGDQYGKIADLAIDVLKRAFASPVEEGCRPALWAATSQEVVEKNVHGCYVVPDKKVTDPSKQAQDDQLGESLWKLSEKILKEKISSLDWEPEFV
jgi:WW domain-containing oxidoreductase